MWLALAQHEQGAYFDAEATWRSVQLPEETQVWRNLALGAALLQQQRVDEALPWFVQATENQPENPLGFYLLAMAAQMQPGASVSRDALPALERAVELSGRFCDRTLAPYAWGEAVDPQGAYTPLVPPSVGHLLGSLGLDDLPNQARVQAAMLHLQQGDFQEAEEQLDQAAEEGFDANDEYRWLEHHLEAAGRTFDAQRVRAKLTDQELQAEQHQATATRQLFGQ